MLDLFVTSLIVSYIQSLCSYLRLVRARGVSFTIIEH